MLRKHFENELAQLSEEVTKMGALCEEAILLTAKDLDEGNKDASAHVASLIDEISAKERSIEGACIRLLMQQQPVASDLRRISAALKMITDMNRIGVQTADVAEIITYMEGKTASECQYIHQEAMEAVKMVTGAVDAFVKHDADLAQSIIDNDDTLDDLFSRSKDCLIDLIMQRKYDGSFILDLLMMAKYFERIGDHAVNIAEWVIFAETGVHKINGQAVEI